jgi:VanZ family protein
VSLDRQPGRAALVYGLALAALLLAPLDPHDASTHGFLRVGRYDTTWRLVKDVVQNLVVFAPFGFLLRRTLARATPGSTAPIIAPVLIATAFALAMESMQSVIPGRYSAITDVMLDAAGAALGAACEPWLRAREPVTSLGDGLAP